MCCVFITDINIKFRVIFNFECTDDTPNNVSPNPLHNYNFFIKIVLLRIPTAVQPIAGIEGFKYQANNS